MEYSKIEEKTIFSIEEEGGEKFVHFYAYGYCAEDDEKPYRLLEYTFCYAPLSEVVSEGFYACEEKYGPEVKQYLTDLETEEDVVKCYEQYDNGNPPKFINAEDIAMDTPCGTYIAL